MNLGAFWAAILCGLLGQKFGWSYGFGLAGVGMLAGLLVFIWGKPLLEGHGELARACAAEGAGAGADQSGDVASISPASSAWR